MEDEASLPLSFYCRNARLWLKKAAFSRRSRLFSDELSHLRKFEALLCTTIPSHPESLRSIATSSGAEVTLVTTTGTGRSSGMVAELQTILPDCQRRILELESEANSGNPQILTDLDGHLSHTTDLSGRSSASYQSFRTKKNAGRCESSGLADSGQSHHEDSTAHSPDSGPSHLVITDLAGHSTASSDSDQSHYHNLGLGGRSSGWVDSIQSSHHATKLVEPSLAAASDLVSEQSHHARNLNHYSSTLVNSSDQSHQTECDFPHLADSSQLQHTPNLGSHSTADSGQSHHTPDLGGYSWASASPGASNYRQKVRSLSKSPDKRVGIMMPVAKEKKDREGDRAAAYSSLSPTKKQQSLGTWTANPQHMNVGSPKCYSSYSSAGPGTECGGALNSPHRSAAVKRGLTKANMKSGALPSKDCPELPTNSVTSDDESLHEMRRGCSDKRNDRRNESSIDVGLSSTTSEVMKTSSQVSEVQQLSLNYSADISGCETLYPDDKRLDRRFSYACRFVERKNEEINYTVQSPNCTDIETEKDDDDDGSERKISSDRCLNNDGDTVISYPIDEGHVTKYSSAEESVDPEVASSCTLEIFSKHLNSSDMNHFSVAGRRSKKRIGHEEVAVEENVVESNQTRCSSKDEMLRRTPPVMSSSSRSHRKKCQNRGVLSVMDDVIRKAMNSHSVAIQTNKIVAHSQGLNKTSSLMMRNKASKKGRLNRDAEEVEAETNVLQSLLGELRGCIEGFTTLIEEEGERWQHEMHSLEKDLHRWKDSTDHELNGMKRNSDDVQQMMDELRRGLNKVERVLEEYSEQGVKLKQGSKVKQEKDPTTLCMDTMKKEMEALVASMKAEVTSELTEKIKQRDMDTLKLGVSKQLEEMRKDMEFALVESEKLRISERKQIEALIEGKIFERSVPQQTEKTVSEKTVADMKEELQMLWDEVDFIAKGREEIKADVEKLSYIAEEAKQKIVQEQDLLKTENGMLKKQLHLFKRESVQVRAEHDMFKRGIEEELDDIRSSLQRVTVCEQTMEKIIEKVVLESTHKIHDSVEESHHGRALIMEKVESISQLYLGGLEDVRDELLRFKLETHDQMKDVEGRCVELEQWQAKQQIETASLLDSLKEISLGTDLENRVLHLEKKVEEQGNLDSLSSIEEVLKEKSGIALEKATNAADMADAIVTEMVASFSTEMENMMRQSQSVQDNLAAQRESARTLASDLMKRVNEEIGREMKMTMDFLSAAKSDGISNIQEEIGKMVDSQKETAEKSEKVLMEVREVQKECLLISTEMARHVNMEEEKLLSLLNQREGSIPNEDKEEKPAAMSHEDLSLRIGKTEHELADLERLVQEVNASIKSLSAKREEELNERDEMIKHDIEDLKKKLEDSSIRSEDDKGENNNRIEAFKNDQQRLRQEMEKFQKKIDKSQDETKQKVTLLETMHLNMASCVQDLQSSNGDLHKSAEMWLQKYASAATLLQDLEKKIMSLEQGIIDRKLEEKELSELDNDENKLDLNNMTPKQKERLINLYRELSCYMQKMKECHGDIDDDGIPVNTKLFESLETRITRVESDAISNLRIVEEKMENVRVGVQTALEGASMAENKCSDLGGQLLKLFRMLPITKKESPSKMTITVSAADELCTNEQGPRDGHIGMRLPLGLNSDESPCMLCKKDSNHMVEQNYHHVNGLDMAFNAERNKPNECYINNSQGVRSYTPEQNTISPPTSVDRNTKACIIHGSKNSPRCHEHPNHNRDGSATPKAAMKRYHERGKQEELSNQSMVGGRNAAVSDGRVSEGKIPIKFNDERKNETSPKKQYTLDGRSDCQSTNTRLGAAKSHVHVRSRPASALASASASASILPIPSKRCDQSNRTPHLL